METAGVSTGRVDDQRKSNGHSSHPLLTGASEATATRAHSHQQIQDLSADQPRCQSLDLEEMDFLHVARMSPHR